MSTKGLRAVLVISLLLVAGEANAQAAPDLNELALDWARGRYISPLLCQLGGEPVRGLRRILVTPGPRHARPPLGRVVFVDMEVDEAARCFNELGESVPNLIGTLDIHLPGASRRDSAQRDFQDRMRRERGFDFDVKEGKLRVLEVRPGPDAERLVDFGGGRARLVHVRKGDDAARLLADFPSPRKLLLHLVAADGSEFRLPLALAADR